MALIKNVWSGSKFIFFKSHRDSPNSEVKHVNTHFIPRGERNTSDLCMIYIRTYVPKKMIYVFLCGWIYSILFYLDVNTSVGCPRKKWDWKAASKTLHKSVVQHRDALAIPRSLPSFFHLWVDTMRASKALALSRDTVLSHSAVCCSIELSTRYWQKS